MWAERRRPVATSKVMAYLDTIEAPRLAATACLIASVLPNYIAFRRVIPLRPSSSARAAQEDRFIRCRSMGHLLAWRDPSMDIES